MHTFITQKHGPAQQKICGQVEQMRSAIESKDVELMVRKQTSSEAQNARALAREKFQQIKRDAVQVQTRVPKLTSQRIEIRKQLEQKEHGLRKLQQIQEREKGELQSLIDEKNEEITRLQQELEAVQAELAFEKQKASSLQEQLQQATKDLEVKSARVQELKSASQEHKAFLYSQRKMVDQLLMQQAAALNSQQRYTEEIEVCYKYAIQNYFPVSQPFLKEPCILLPLFTTCKLLSSCCTMVAMPYAQEAVLRKGKTEINSERPRPFWIKFGMMI